MAIILGLASALTYGAADFLGGLATRRTKVLSVVLLSQLFGSVLLVAILPFFREAELSADAIWWGALAGIGGAVGIALFYQGLSIGRMSAVAPITAVEAATVPVLFGLAIGERPTPVALGGILLALLAVGLVSASAEPEPAVTSAGSAAARTLWLRSGVAHALGAGLAFGAFFILLDRAGDSSGLWPLVGARISSVALIVLAIVATRGWERPPPAGGRIILAAGALDVAANTFYLLATREGLLSIVAVLTSMYPASTVLLARMTLGERFGRTQSIGLVIAVAGVVAIAIG